MADDNTVVTFEQKLLVLLSYGFFVGLRDTRFNTDHPGHYMVMECSIAEAEESDELPTRDGANGPWCLVGDNLAELMAEAFNHASMFSHFDAVVEDIIAGGVGMLHPDGTGAGPIIRG